MRHSGRDLPPVTSGTVGWVGRCEAAACSKRAAKACVERGRACTAPHSSKPGAWAANCCWLRTVGNVRRARDRRRAPRQSGCVFATTKKIDPGIIYMLATWSTQIGRMRSADGVVLMCFRASRKIVKNTPGGARAGYLRDFNFWWYTWGATTAALLFCFGSGAEALGSTKLNRPWNECPIRNSRVAGSRCYPGSRRCR